MNNDYHIKKRRDDLLYEQKEKEFQERIAPLRIIRAMKKEEEKKKLLLDCDGGYCGHKQKMEINGMLVCQDCGKELGKCYGRNVGYNNKNHVMRGGKKK